MWAASAVGSEQGRGLGELRDQLRELERQHDQLADQVEQLTKAEEIGAAVATAIRHERQQLLTWPRKVAAVALALVLAVPAVHELVVIVVG